MAEDEDPEAGVRFRRCLACGFNGGYTVRGIFQMEHLGPVEECKRVVLHGRVCIECGDEIRKVFESRVYCSRTCQAKGAKLPTANLVTL